MWPSSEFAGVRTKENPPGVRTRERLPGGRTKEHILSARTPTHLAGVRISKLVKLEILQTSMFQVFGPKGMLCVVEPRINIYIYIYIYTNII